MKNFLINLSNRCLYPEKMDDRTSDRSLLFKTLDHFYYINRFLSNSRKYIKQYIIKDMERDKMKLYTFLELGAGGCDIAVWLDSYCKKKKINLKIYCLDNDPRIIEYAVKKCRGKDTISLIQDDIFNIDLSTFKPDYVFCNHVIHHFSDIQVSEILLKLTTITKKIALINDIVRSPIAFILYYCISSLFFRNSFAFYDGCLSIRKSFTPIELKTNFESIKKPFSYSIHRRFPFRLICVINNKMLI